MNIKNNKNLSDFIFDIYRSSIDYSYWGHVLKQLTDSVGGNRAAITSRDNDSGHVQVVDIFTTKTHNFDMEYIDRYIQSMYLSDVWIKIEQNHNRGELCIYSEHLKWAELEKTEFYNDWLKPQNIKDGLAVQLFKTDNYRIVLNIFFDEINGSNRSLDDFKILIPHLSQAVEIWMVSVGAEEISPFQIKHHFLKENCGLTDREIAIAYAYIYVDNRNRIAEKFKISPETVKSTLHNIKQKLGGINTEEMKRKIGSFASVGDIKDSD